MGDDARCRRPRSASWSTAGLHGTVEAEARGPDHPGARLVGPVARPRRCRTPRTPAAEPAAPDDDGGHPPGERGALGRIELGSEPHLGPGEVLHGDDDGDAARHAARSVRIGARATRAGRRRRLTRVQAMSSIRVAVLGRRVLGDHGRPPLRPQRTHGAVGAIGGDGRPDQHRAPESPLPRRLRPARHADRDHRSRRGARAAPICWSWACRRRRSGRPCGTPRPTCGRGSRWSA